VRATGQLLADATAGCGAVFIDSKGDAVAALSPCRYPEDRARTPVVEVWHLAVADPARHPAFGGRAASYCGVR